MLKSKYLVLLCMAQLSILVGCGKNNNNTAAAPGSSNPTTCNPGQVLSSSGHGCLQFTGQPNMGLYNGQLEAAGCWSGTQMSQSGCIPTNGYTGLNNNGLNNGFTNGFNNGFNNGINGGVNGSYSYYSGQNYSNSGYVMGCWIYGYGAPQFIPRPCPNAIY